MIVLLLMLPEEALIGFSPFKKEIFCNYCNKEGHTRNECFKLHGILAGHPFNKGRTGNNVASPHQSSFRSGQGSNGGTNGQGRTAMNVMQQNVMQ